MLFLSRRLGVALGLSVGLAHLGCATNAEISKAMTGPPTPPETATLAFDDPGTLTLAWGEAQALYVTVKPPMQYRVGFSLLGNFDAAFDGALDDAIVFTGDDGHGLVTLHAPAQSTTFSVRASL